jgi:hypothetical protein
LEHNNRASWISRTWFADKRTRDEDEALVVRETRKSLLDE